jgi:hypothetical protein
LRRGNAFTNWTDVLHAILGLACAMLRRVFWPLSLVMILAFAVYEALEAESRLDSYEDLVEFMIGSLIGLILLP